jgi:hypothetical protein
LSSAALKKHHCRVEKSLPKGKKGFGSRAMLFLFYAAPFIVVLGVVGVLGYNRLAHKPPPTREISTSPFAAVKIKNLTASLYAQGDTLRALGNDVFIEFRDAAGKLVDVGDVTFELDLHMPNMVMHSIGKVLRTATPGQYRTSIEPQMGGEWTAKITISGADGTADATLPLKVK